MLLNRLLNGMQPQVLWTDEKLFTVQAHNIQDHSIWLKNKDSVLVKQETLFRRQKPGFVMVWAGVTTTDLKTSLIFIKDGVKITCLSANFAS